MICEVCKKTMPLSQDERKLIGLLSLGYCNKEIAKALKLTPQGVKNRLGRLYRKQKVEDRLQLVCQFYTQEIKELKGKNGVKS